MVMPACLALIQALVFAMGPNLLQFYVYGQCVAPVMMFGAMATLPDRAKEWGFSVGRLRALSLVSALLAPFVTWNLLAMSRSTHLNVCVILWLLATLLFHYDWCRTLSGIFAGSKICRAAEWIWRMTLLMFAVLGTAWTYLLFREGGEFFTFFDFMLSPGAIQRSIWLLVSLGFLAELCSSSHLVFWMRKSEES